MREYIVEAGQLAVACLEWGPQDGWPCLMGHGFPYSPHAFADAAPILADAGARVIAPWLRGYGPTRFLSPDTPRSGEQAALGRDMLALMDALDDNDDVQNVTANFVIPDEVMAELSADN